MKKATKDKPADAPLRLEWLSPAELEENPANWRKHPETQVAALSDVIAEVGWAGACLYNERTGRLIDGHARKKVALANGEPKIPVLIGSWDEVTEKKILATLDPLAAMAEADSGKLDSLLREVQTESSAVAGMLADLGGYAVESDKATVLKPMDTMPPPKMAWVLIGIPTVRFGEIAPQVEAIAGVEGVICETTANDG